MSSPNDPTNKPNKKSRAGILFKGKASQETLCLGVCLGVDLEESEMLIKTLCGAPDPSYLRNVDFEDPSEARHIFIDVKRVMRESDRGFYVDQVESTLERFWTDHRRDVCNLLRTLPREEAENDLHELFLETFSPPQLESLDLKVVGFDDIDLKSGSSNKEPDTAENQQDQPENNNEPTRQDRRTSRSVHRVEPVLDISNGIVVNDLKPGTEISVRLAGETAHEVKKRVANDPLVQLPPIPATVLSVDQESDSDSFTIITQLQEGIYGIAKTRDGSKIESDATLPNQSATRYDNYVQSLIWITVTWFVLLAIFLYFIII